MIHSQLGNTVSLLGDGAKPLSVIFGPGFPYTTTPFASLLGILGEPYRPAYIAMLLGIHNYLLWVNYLLAIKVL